MPDDPNINRRRFFRAGLGELLKPLAKAVQPLAQIAREIERLERPVNTPASTPVSQNQKRGIPLDVWLRPPGALPELQFRSTCSKCGECVKVCPAQCIKIDPKGQLGNGVPYIDADTMACVVCDGLFCMEGCPSGALAPTPVAEIDMGTAVWRENLCLRKGGENCTICIDQCPLGAAAIHLNGNAVEVVFDTCIGCGVCQHDCPTDPKAIFVVPIAAKTA